MTQGVKDLITEADNETYDVVRLAILFSIIVINALTIYGVLSGHDDWKDIITQYAGAVSMLIGSSGIGLYFKAGTESIARSQNNESTTSS